MLLGVQVKPLLNIEAEFAPPAWMFGGRSYQPLPGGAFLAVYRCVTIL